MEHFNLWYQLKIQLILGWTLTVTSCTNSSRSWAIFTCVTSEWLTKLTHANMPISTVFICCASADLTVSTIAYLPRITISIQGAALGRWLANTCYACTSRAISICSTCYILTNVCSSIASLYINGKCDRTISIRTAFYCLAESIITDWVTITIIICGTGLGLTISWITSWTTWTVCICRTISHCANTIIAEMSTWTIIDVVAGYFLAKTSCNNTN